jgi:(+)-trans-carveol dehydrogenase
MGRVEGKVAFVTGAARGQGRSHALRLASEGADIVAIDICEDIAGVPFPQATREDLQETATLVRALGRRIVAARADVRDLASLEHALSEAVAVIGTIDIVIANAAINSYGLTSEMPVQAWRDVVDVNLTGVWQTVKAAIPHLNEGGSVIITSSVAGLQGFANITHYASAKHGLVGLSRSLAHELGPRGIRVNTIHPTQVRTAMILNDETYHLFAPEIEQPTVKDLEERSQMGMVIPVPWIEPEDVSNAVLFLASDESRFITGVALPVDAGALLR